MGIKKLAMILKKVAWLLPGFLLWAAFVPLAEKTNVLFALAPMMFYTRLECYSKASTWLWFKNGIVFWVLTLSWMPAIVKNGACGAGSPRVGSARGVLRVVFRTVWMAGGTFLGMGEKRELLAEAFCDNCSRASFVGGAGDCA